MRLENWHSKEIFQGIMDQALVNANVVMDEVADDAKMRCPVDTKTYRPDGWANAHVEFTPKTGAWKNKLVSFNTKKRWVGRKPGDLLSTIRRVNRPGSGNIRVYAGNFKIYWAFMVEKGTSRTKAQPFLKPSFHRIKKDIVKMIKNGGSL